MEKKQELTWGWKAVVGSYQVYFFDYKDCIVSNMKITDCTYLR